MTMNDADQFFRNALSRAAASGNAAELRDVLERLFRDLSEDSAALIQVRALLERIQDGADTQVPHDWIGRANARIAELEAAVVAAPGVIDRARDVLREVARVIEAQLVGDTFAGQALQGIRGSTSLQPRQLHFASDLGDVHLQVDRSRHGHAIMGQFVPSRHELLDDAITAQATTESGSVSAQLDPGAQFYFTDVQDGEIRIELNMGKDSLRLAPFLIRSRQEE